LYTEVGGERNKAAEQNGKMGNFGRKRPRYFLKLGRFSDAPSVSVGFLPGGVRSAGEGRVTIGASHRLKADVPTRLWGDGAAGNGQTSVRRECAASFVAGTTVSGARPA